MMDRLVAKPLRILSQYFMTSAVISPQKTGMNTVAHAHAPKMRNMFTRKPFESGGDMAYRTGRRAAIREGEIPQTKRPEASISSLSADI
jgi:hypothetical protein